MSDVLCGCKGCATARKPLQDAIARVRKLHKPISGGKYCISCEDAWRDPAPYPCETIKALDGEQ